MPEKKTTKPPDTPTSKYMMYTVTYEDGTTVEGDQTPRVNVAFEAHFDVAVTDIDRPSFTQMCWIAWKSVRDERPFDEWIETVIDVEPKEMVGKPGPLGRPASRGG